VGHLDGLYIRHVLNAKHALGCTGTAGSSERSSALTRRGLRSNTAFGGRRLQTYGIRWAQVANLRGTRLAQVANLRYR
jgi:hypothetical protein